MTKVLDAAQRVRDAMQEKRDREASAAATVAAAERERAAAVARQERDARDARDRFATRESAGQEALSASAEAVTRIEQAERTAANLLREHARDHAVRRDVAEAALEKLLAQTDSLAVERQLRKEVERLPSLLCDPSRSTDLIRLAGLAAHARHAGDVAGLLRGLLDDGQYSPLTSTEFEKVRAAAKTHQAAIKQAVQDARRHNGDVGHALRRIELGHDVDAAIPAALVLDANETAQAALHAMNAVLFPTTNAEEAT